MHELTEVMLNELISLGVKYASKNNMDPHAYMEGLIDPSTIGDSCPYTVVALMIKYHKQALGI